MINNNFINLQAKTQLNNRELSELLDCFENTVKRYRKGINAVPVHVIRKINEYINYLNKDA